MAQQRLIGNSPSQVPTNGMLGTLAFVNAANAAFPAPVNISLGSAAAPSIAFTGDINTGIYSPGADQVGISTGGTLRFQVSTTAATSTLPVVFPLGAVGTPSITFTGDLNTGIWSPAADTIAFSEGGVEAMRIDSSGRVGIGTTSPSEALTVTGNIRANYSNARIGVYGDNSSSPGFTIGNSAGTSHYIIYETIDGSGNRGSFNIYDSVTGVIRLTIDTSGRLLVGTTTTTGFPSGARHIFLDGQTTYGSFSIGNQGSGIFTDINLTGWSGSGSNYFTSKIRQDGSTGALTFYTQSTISSDGTGTTTERMRIDSSGRLLVGTTTANTSGAKLQTVDGITFPATQVASADPNTLDDYEEGTWTPAIAGTTLAGAGTYSVQVGRYTKIGNTVTAHFNLTWSAHTGTGNMLISGLPFTSANVTNLNPAAVAYANNLTITGISVILVTANATTGTINSVNNGTAAALAIDTAATLITTITYQTA